MTFHASLGFTYCTLDQTFFRSTGISIPWSGHSSPKRFKFLVLILVENISLDPSNQRVACFSRHTSSVVLYWHTSAKWWCRWEETPAYYGDNSCLLFPVLDREMREGSSTDASIDVTYEYLFACFIPSFMESFISSSLTRLVTSDEPSTYSSIYRKKFCD